jgi:predicted MFS family arabinose efflux permease
LLIAGPSLLGVGAQLVGALLSIVGLSALVYGIIEEPVHGWGDIQVFGPIAGGALLIAAFVVWQLRTRAPLVDLNLFRNRRFALSTVAFTIVGFAMTGVLFVLSPYLQVVQHNDAQGTGVRLLPLIAAMMVGAVSSDWLAKRVGAKVMVAGGMLGIAAGMLLLSRAGADSGYELVAIALAVMGLAIALTMIPALDAILAALPDGQTGAGSALTRAIQNVGASFGVAVMGSVLNSAYQAHLSGQLDVFPAAVRAAAETSVAVAAAAARHLPAPLGDRLALAANGAYAQGMSEVLVVTAGLLVVGAVLMALFLPARAPRVEQAGPVAAEVATA